MIAGGASAGYNGNGRPALGALLDHPGDVKLGPGGDVFVSDGANGQVRVIDGAGTIRAAPGGGNGLTWRCQNGGELPQPGGPTAVAAAPDGSVYIANATGQQVKRIDRAGRVGTVAGSARAARSCRPKGSGCAGYRGDGGPATAALLDTPSALALRPPGTLYVYDSGNARVRVINVGGDPVTANGITVEPGAIETVAGTGHTGLAGDGGSALRAEIGNSPGQLAVSARGDVFIGDPSRGSVRRVGATGTISTVAGHGASEDLQRCCSLPVGLAADGSGNLYVAASGPPPEIRFLNLGAGPVTVQRARVEPGSSLVLKAEAEPPDPSGGGLAGLGAIAVDRRGTVYAVHDLLQDDHVDSIDDSGHLTTVIGYPESGFNGDGRLGRLTLLNSPGGLSLDPCGNVVLADTGNDRVRRWRIAPACRLVAEEKMGRGNGHGVPLVIGALAVGATLLLAVAGLLASHGRRAASTRGGRGLFA